MASESSRGAFEEGTPGVGRPEPTATRSAGQRIGVFGGTFDPPHIGHLVAAVNVRAQLELDVVLLVVANEPWQKVDERTVSPAADRLAMVAAAVAGVDGVQADDREIQRGGPTYTADTLAELRGEGAAALFLALGEDAAAGLSTWKRVDEVRAAAEVVVVTRAGDGHAIDQTWVQHVVEIPRLDVSSSDLRRRVADGRPIDGLVPPSVAFCISERGLYGGARV